MRKKSGIVAIVGFLIACSMQAFAQYKPNTGDRMWALPETIWLVLVFAIIIVLVFLVVKLWMSRRQERNDRWSRDHGYPPSHRRTENANVHFEERESGSANSVRPNPPGSSGLQLEDTKRLFDNAIEGLQGEIGRPKELLKSANTTAVPAMDEDRLYERLSGILRDETRKLRDELAGVREMLVSFMGADLRHQSETLKEKLGVLEAFRKTTPVDISGRETAEQKKRLPLTEENLVKWWNIDGDKYLKVCEQSLRDTFDPHIDIKVVKCEVDEKESWHLMAVKEPGCSAYFVLPRKMDPYVTLRDDSLRNWFLADPENYLMNNRSARIVSLLKPAISTADIARDKQRDMPAQKGTVEIK